MPPEIYTPPYKLTKKGQEFLDLIRDESVWQKIIQAVDSTFGEDATIDDYFAVAKAVRIQLEKGENASTN